MRNKIKERKECEKGSIYCFLFFLFSLAPIVSTGAHRSTATEHGLLVRPEDITVVAEVVVVVGAVSWMVSPIVQVSVKCTGVDVVIPCVVGVVVHSVVHGHGRCCSRCQIRVDLLLCV